MSSFAKTAIANSNVSHARHQDVPQDMQMIMCRYCESKGVQEGNAKLKSTTARLMLDWEEWGGQRYPDELELGAEHQAVTQRMH